MAGFSLGLSGLMDGISVPSINTASVRVPTTTMGGLSGSSSSGIFSGLSSSLGKLSSTISSSTKNLSLSGIMGLSSSIKIPSVSNISATTLTNTASGLTNKVNIPVTEITNIGKIPVPGADITIPGIKPDYLSGVTGAVKSLATSLRKTLDDVIPPSISIPGVKALDLSIDRDKVIPGTATTSLSGTVSKVAVDRIAIPVTETTNTSGFQSAADAASRLLQDGGQKNPNVPYIPTTPQTYDNTKATDYTKNLLSKAMGLVNLFSFGQDKFQRAYNWELLLPGMGLINQDIIGRYIQDVSFGEYSMDEISKVRYGAETRGHAGVLTIPQLKVKFFKPAPDLVYTYLMLWKNLIVDALGFYSPKNNYALTGYFMFFDTKGGETATYKLTGLFPAKFPEHTVSYSDDNIANYTVDFNVDRIEMI